MSANLSLEKSQNHQFKKIAPVETKQNVKMEKWKKHFLIVSSVLLVVGLLTFVGLLILAPNNSSKRFMESRFAVQYKTCLNNETKYCVKRLTHGKLFRQESKSIYVPTSIKEEYADGSEEVIPGVSIESTNGRLLEEVSQIDEQVLNQLPFIIPIIDPLTGVATKLQVPKNVDPCYYNAVADVLEAQRSGARMLFETSEVETDAELSELLYYLQSHQSFTIFELETPTDSKRMLQTYIIPQNVEITPVQPGEQLLFQHTYNVDQISLFDSLKLEVWSLIFAKKKKTIENLYNEFQVTGQYVLLANDQTLNAVHNLIVSDLNPITTNQASNSTQSVLNLKSQKARSCQQSYDLQVKVTLNSQGQLTDTFPSSDITLKQTLQVELDGSLTKTNGKFREVTKVKSVKSGEWLTFNAQLPINLDYSMQKSLGKLYGTKSNNLVISQIVEKSIAVCNEVKIKVCVSVLRFKVCIVVQVKNCVEQTVNQEKDILTVINNGEQQLIATQESALLS